MSILAPMSPAIPARHPGWCDPRACSTDDEYDADQSLVLHSAVLLDDGHRVVVIEQAEVVNTDGAQLVEAEPVTVQVRTGQTVDLDVPAAEAAALGFALLRAAGLVEPRGHR